VARFDARKSTRPVHVSIVLSESRLPDLLHSLLLPQMLYVAAPRHRFADDARVVARRKPERWTQVILSARSRGTGRVKKRPGRARGSPRRRGCLTLE